MPYQFASEWGRKLCKKILLETLNEHPHDHQLDVVTHALDRKDVLSITYTGSGKSGYIYMFVAVVNAIMADPELCPTAQFPRNPVVVVICPTISLEEDLELKMKKYRIDSMVLSKERREEYQRNGIDIFKAIETGSHRVLLMTPEMLTSPAFTALCACYRGAQGERRRWDRRPSEPPISRQGRAKQRVERWIYAQ